jgi:hypothetical protein
MHDQLERRFIVTQYIMNSPEPERESVELARYDNLEDAIIAGLFFKQLLPDECGQYIEEHSGTPNIQVLEQTSANQFVRQSTLDDFRETVSGLIAALRGAKKELDWANSPPPF